MIILVEEKEKMKRHAILFMLLELVITMDAGVLPTKGKERVMHDGPKVAIRSTALNVVSRQKSSDLHEIYLTPYRYVSSTCSFQSSVIENAIDTSPIYIIHSGAQANLSRPRGFLATNK